MQSVDLVDGEQAIIRTVAGPIAVSASVIGSRGPVIFITPGESFTFDSRAESGSTLMIERAK